MTANVDLKDFPDVHKMHFVQGSQAKPGRCVIDCTVGNPGTLGSVGPARPRVTTLKAQTDGWFATWNDMRVVKAIKSRYDCLHVVLEDSRWILEEHKLDQNWNDRDAFGRIKSGTQQSISQLVTQILNACDNRISIVVDRTVPTFKPPARWAEKTCAEAMQNLLDNTGCRLVYAPETGAYVMSLAGSGNLPDFPVKKYKPAPNNNLKNVRFMTAPAVYEERVACTAVYIDSSTGDATALAADTTLSLVHDASASEHVQHDYRLWKPSASSDRIYIKHRPKSILNDPERPQYEQGRVIRDAWEPFPVHQPLVSKAGSITGIIELTNGGQVFVTDHPVLSAQSGGTISTAATVLTGFYKKDGANGLYRDHVPVMIDATQTTELKVFVDWVVPISSSEPDIHNPPLGDWQSLFQQVCQALVRKYNPPEPAQTITTDKFHQLGGIGQIGGIEYEFSIAQRQAGKKHTMRIALNHQPGTESMIR